MRPADARKAARSDDSSGKASTGETAEPISLLEAYPSRRVCIVLLTGIGDVIHGLPLANDLKRHDPGRQVMWIAEPAPAAVLENHPAVDEIIVYHKKRGLRGITGLAADLRGRRCDITLNVQRYFKSIVPTLLTRSPVRVGLPRSKTRDGVSLFLTHHLPEQPWRHTQDLFLDFRRLLGVPADDPIEWKITFTGREIDEQHEFFARLPDRPIVGVVLATANPAKDWPVDRYIRLIEILQAELGFLVLLVGGPGGREVAAADAIMAQNEHVLSGLSQSVRRMLWMLEGVDLLVSPDTGPLHAAHALGTPVVGLYGHTNPARFGPYLHSRELIIDRYTEPGEPPDPGEYRSKTGRMTAITVEEVVEKVRIAAAAIRGRKDLAGLRAVERKTP